MPSTYEPIQSYTLASATATITFSSIASSWTDLRLVLVPIGTATLDPLIRFNSDSSTNYSTTELVGNGSSAVSYRGTNSTEIDPNRASGSANATPELITMDIFSYAGSTFKTCLVETNSDKNGSGGIARVVGLWRSTSAINALSITANTSTFAIGTTATLYGIKNA